MNDKIKKLVIPAAGLGTNHFPFTKNLSRLFLPIGKVPIVNYILKEIQNTDIDEIFFVVSKRHLKTLKEYFKASKLLNNKLYKLGMMESLVILEEVTNLSADIKINFIVQKNEVGLGNAILQAKKYISNEYFAVLLPDFFIDSYAINKINSSDVTYTLENMVNIFSKMNSSIIGFHKIGKLDSTNYNLIKKLAANTRFSNDIYGVNINYSNKNDSSFYTFSGRYIFNENIFDYLEREVIIDYTDKLDLIKPLINYSKRNKLHGYLITKNVYDLSSQYDYLRAEINQISSRDSNIKAKLTNHYKKHLK